MTWLVTVSSGFIGSRLCGAIPDADGEVEMMEVLQIVGVVVLFGFVSIVWWLILLAVFSLISKVLW